jgi:hypothetical protein
MRCDALTQAIGHTTNAFLKTSYSLSDPNIYNTTNAVDLFRQFTTHSFLENSCSPSDPNQR